MRNVLNEQLNETKEQRQINIDDEKSCFSYQHGEDDSGYCLEYNSCDRWSRKVE